MSKCHGIDVAQIAKNVAIAADITRRTIDERGSHMHMAQTIHELGQDSAERERGALVRAPSSSAQTHTSELIQTSTLKDLWTVVYKSS